MHAKMQIKKNILKKIVFQNNLRRFCFFALPPMAQSCEGGAAALLFQQLAVN